MPPQHDIVNIPAVHNQGITRLVFSKDGKKIYTGGHDSMMRIWVTDAPTDQESDAYTEHDEPVTWLDCNSDMLLTACEDAAVRIYGANNGEFKGYLTRTEAVAVRSVVFDPKGEKAVVTSDETIFKIITLADPTNIIKITGHMSPVRSASWDPKGTYLATSGADGKIMIWDVVHGEQPAQSKVLDIIPTVDADSDKAVCDTTAVWHPSGKYFVVGTKTNEITMIARETWSKAGTFSIEGHIGEITGLAFSPNGLYLASAGKDGQLIIWDTEKRRVVEREKASNSPPAITSVAWSPSTNLIAFVDADGSFKRWRSPVKAALPHPVVPRPTEQKQAPVSRSKTNQAPDADAEFWMGDNEALEDEIDKDLNDFDIADIENEPEEEEMQGPDGVIAASLAKQMVAVSAAQPAFQPGSTPMKEGKRYLAWTMLGFVQAIDQGSYQYVTVELYDKTVRTGDRFQDRDHFTMASLGERGVLYASAIDGKNPSVIEYKPFREASWAINTQWKQTLPEGEEAIAIAAGGQRLEKHDEDDVGGDDAAGCGVAVVATSKGYVRFFSGSGVQQFIWSAGADVVSIAAGEEWVFIVYREGGVSLDGCQNLRYTLVSFDSFEPIQEGRLPLLKRVTLQWLGITEDGAPSIYDSAGVLHVLQHFRRPGKAMWTPALDTNTLARREGKQESYWPVGVSGIEFHCVILKGLEEHPSPNRPPLTEHMLQMPLLSLRTDKGEPAEGTYEEKVIREKATIKALRDALTDDDLDSEDVPARELEMDKALVWLIGKACMQNKVQRAFDLCRMLQRPASLRTAMKAAERFILKGLEQRIEGLLKESEDKDTFDDHRKQRQKWGYDSAPLEAPSRQQRNAWASTSFDNFPPPKERPSLAPAIPMAVRKPFPPQLKPQAAAPISVLSREPSFVPETQATVALDDPMDMDWPPTPPANGKRKRDDSQLTEDSTYMEDLLPSKRKTSEEESSARSSGPAKSFNPFARKPGNPGGHASNNPFARQTKVIAAKTSTGGTSTTATEASRAATKSKAGSKKDEPARQSTLWGVAAPPPAPPSAKRARGRPAKAGSAHEKSLESITESATLPETQDTLPIHSESQETTAADASGNQEVIATREVDIHQSIDEEMDTADTQQDDEEPLGSAVHKTLAPESPGSSDKENVALETPTQDKLSGTTEKAGSGDGKSKLAAFRMNVATT